MTRYYAAAFLFCMLGMVAAIVFDRPLSALLFSLGASCFVLRAWWAMRRPEPVEGWTVDKAFAPLTMSTPDGWHAGVIDWMNQPPTDPDFGLVILPPGAALGGVRISYPQWRKREAFRRYREHWAGVGQ